jgi:hypothetical protein
MVTSSSIFASTILAPRGRGARTFPRRALLISTRAGTSRRAFPAAMIMRDCCAMRAFSMRAHIAPTSRRCVSRD